MVVVVSGVVVLAIGLPGILNRSETARLLRTTSELRSLGVAIQSYGGRHGFYPDVDSFEELSPLLQSVNLVSSKDAWGHPLAYISSNSPSHDLGECQFSIGSSGRDGSWELDDLWAYEPGITTKFDCDIIYRNDAFIRFNESAETGRLPPVR